MGTEGSRGDLIPEMPKEGRWIAKPRKARWTLPVVTGVVLISQAPNWVTRLFDSHQSSPLLRLFSILLLSVLVAVFLYSAATALLGRRLRDKDRAMLDESFGDQFPVDVTISSSGKGLATDRGVLWFADGLMGFSGESASFVLAASDLAPRWDAAKRPKNWNQLPPDAISLVGAPREAHIVITPLRGKWRAYRERLAAFMRADEEPRGERQWPPLYPYAEEPPALEPVVRR